jgi:hypothetical protein
MQRIRDVTDRPIIYRAKSLDIPRWNAGMPPNVTVTQGTRPIADVLQDTWAVVTHHSNVAVDGLVMGVPAFTSEGVAATLALSDVAKIERPYFPDDLREQWANDVAYCQWSLREMRSGIVWRHLQEEGLL